jgi:hypothetical protein
MFLNSLQTLNLICAQKIGKKHEKISAFIEKIEIGLERQKRELVNSLELFFQSLHTVGSGLISQYSFIKSSLKQLSPSLQEISKPEKGEILEFLCDSVMEMASLIEENCEEETKKIDKILTKYSTAGVGVAPIQQLLKDLTKVFGTASASKKHKVDACKSEDMFRASVSCMLAHASVIEVEFSEKELAQLVGKSVFPYFVRAIDSLKKRDLESAREAVKNLRDIELAREIKFETEPKLKITQFFDLQLLNIDFLLKKPIDEALISQKFSLEHLLPKAQYLIKNGDEEQVIFNYLKIFSLIETMKQSAIEKREYSFHIILACLEEGSLDEAIDIISHQKNDILRKNCTAMTEIQREGQNLMKLFLDKAINQIRLLKTQGHLTMMLGEECRLFLTKLKSNQLEMIEILVGLANHFDEVDEKTNVVHQYAFMLAEMGALRKRMLDVELAKK